MYSRCCEERTREEVNGSCKIKLSLMHTRLEQALDNVTMLSAERLAKKVVAKLAVRH